MEQLTTFGEEVDLPILTVGYDHFVACTNLKHVHIPSSAEVGDAKDINSFAIAVFPPSTLSVTFPSSTRSIGSYAFIRSANLNYVDLSRCEKLTKIGETVFNECKKLTQISMPKRCNVTVIPDRFVEYCPALMSIDLSGCSNLQTIENMAFYSRDLFASTFSYAILPASVKTIENGAFCYFREGYGNDVHPNFRTLIWVGCSARPSGVTIANNAFGKPLDTLISEKTIQEIFVP